MKSRQLVRASLICAIGSLCAGITLAQGILEEVVVTATKRAESIQDVPVSVSTVSSEQIENQGILDMEDLSLYVPNFEINSASILPNIYMRGLGPGATHSIEQSVGRFVDGVYISRAAINLHGFMDVENVEFLRGPQGTLFGKNTVAGALIINTADPTANFESGFSVSASSYSTTGGNRQLQGFVSGPLGENLAGRIAVRLGSTDGFYINRLQGPGGPNGSDTGVRMKLAWTPTDQTSVDLKVEFDRFDSEGPDTAEIADVGGPPLFVYQIPSPNFTPELDWIVDVDCTDIVADRDTDGDGAADTSVNAGSFCPSRDQESSNVTLTIEHDFADGTLTSISALQDYDYKHNFVGLDMGLASGFRARRNETYENFSQELRYTSNDSDTFDYIVGAYFEDTEVNRHQNSSINLVTIFRNPGHLFMDRYEPWTIGTRTSAAFGQVRWHFTDDLTLILGGRYASETKDFDFERYFAEYGTNNRLAVPGGPGGPPLAVTDSRSETKFTGSATLQWQSSDNAMLYAAFSQGHKTGGFSDRIDNPMADYTYDEENVNSIELGAKTTSLNGALTFNVAAFFMDIEGLQLATQIPGTVPAFSVSNAADSSSDGVEIDLTWAVNEIWTLGANAAVTDAIYDSFPGAECHAGTPVTPDPVTGTCDLAGLPLIFAPDFKGTVFADFLVEDAIGGWDLGGRFDYTRSGEHYTDISYQDNVLTEAYSIVNGGLRLVSPNERLTVSLIGTNLSDEAFCAWCIPSGPNVLAAMNPPREIALRFSADFD